jgi:hypothetical protein
MNTRRVTSSVAAAILVSGAIGLAQSPSPVITVAGCVQKESNVLKRNPVAANVGMDDEFVLTNAAIGETPGSSEAPKPDVQPPAAAVGTSGSPGNFGKVYRVTGDKEAELKSYVGQRVEISGTFKDKEPVTDAMSSVGTSGKTELTPANTREITIDAIKPLTGTCTPAIK